MQSIFIWIVLTPLFGAIIAGLFGKQIGRAGAHWATILGVAVSCVLSMIVFKYMVLDNGTPINETVYTWL
ncbi:MAG: NADH-quinone oxidoreductase subunit L, partial [Gammaproteobacteria bacterium]|nr:NADH-quinone oxidoreductase subunit L [Gammaproteobacteria bacterium]